MSATRSLVYAPNWVGDTVMALPVLAALAAAGRAVDVLARPHLVPLVGLAAGAAGALSRGDDRTTLAAMRAGGYDEAVLLPNSFRSAWLARRAGIPRRFGYRGGFRGPLLAPAVPRAGGAVRHQTADYAELLAAMGVPSPEDWTPRLALGATERERGRQLLARAGIDPAAGPVVGVFPGAEFGASKRWPREHFADAMRELRRRHRDLQLSILAGPKEVWLAVRLHEETGKIHPVIGPDLDLGELAAVLAAHRALLTNDSGPMHLAAALGVHCAALFGPTDPARTAPSGAGHEVLYGHRWCSPCFRRRCPLGHHRCMTDLPATAAVAAVEAGL
ncbi:MAG: lipopolysaccharide heptosyltransferase II [Acidobacteriota bacterium]|nr:lipopolysaccharide heptosyltransferase II [Acidobacteriota bacterium]MDH3521971.1 lipopolysaccharide heptosyltransferase II [Acidobacteriota bacterium]